MYLCVCLCVCMFFKMIFCIYTLALSVLSYTSLMGFCCLPHSSSCSTCPFPLVDGSAASSILHLQTVLCWRFLSMSPCVNISVPCPWRIATRFCLYAAPLFYYKDAFCRGSTKLLVYRPLYILHLPNKWAKQALLSFFQRQGNELKGTFVAGHRVLSSRTRSDGANSFFSITV